MDLQKILSITATIALLLICSKSLLPLIFQSGWAIVIVLSPVFLFLMLLFALFYYSVPNFIFFRLHSENTLLSLSEALTALVSAIAYLIYPAVILLASMLIAVTIANIIQLTDIMRSILINSFFVVSSFIYLFIVFHISKKAQMETESVYEGGNK